MDDPDGYFGQHVAATYDDSTDDEFTETVIDATVDFLTAQAAGGPALELAVGTGRIALPLARRGVPVHGIDMSRAMTDRLRAKPGGDQIPVTLGDFATTRVEGDFTLVYLLYNTVMNLTTQDAQVACFENAARHLTPGGRFVVEVLVPQLRRLPAGQHVVPYHAGPTRWSYDVYDTATQATTSHHVHVADGRGEHHSVPFRYVWPSELDLMARIAGLRPAGRWAGWAGEPFTGESERHVSVWERPVG
ncbi:class I SAM-dependent methyltransferase [Streptomyces sp. NPDC004539]|uniref:class I SAM-dependent DNA methyltransferase n=1 Tax=Streptomyces sp. NPDC004539 TaxID=3154280 RepID=UPI0033AEE1CE